MALRCFTRQWRRKRIVSCFKDISSIASTTSPSTRLHLSSNATPSSCESRAPEVTCTWRHVLLCCCCCLQSVRVGHRRQDQYFVRKHDEREARWCFWERHRETKHKKSKIYNKTTITVLRSLQWADWLDRHVLWSSIFSLCSVTSKCKRKTNKPSFSSNKLYWASNPLPPHRFQS